jgi:hypothetical protein
MSVRLQVLCLTSRKRWSDTNEKNKVVIGLRPKFNQCTVLDRTTIFMLQEHSGHDTLIEEPFPMGEGVEGLVIYFILLRQRTLSK